MRHNRVLCIHSHFYWQRTTIRTRFDQTILATHSLCLVTKHFLFIGFGSGRPHILTLVHPDVVRLIHFKRRDDARKQTENRKLLYLLIHYCVPHRHRVFIPIMVRVRRTSALRTCRAVVSAPALDAPYIVLTCGSKCIFILLDRRAALLWFKNTNPSGFISINRRENVVAFVERARHAAAHEGNYTIMHSTKSYQTLQRHNFLSDEIELIPSQGLARNGTDARMGEGRCEGSSNHHSSRW